MTQAQDGTQKRRFPGWIGFAAAGLIGALAGSAMVSVASANGGGPGRGGFFRHHGDPEAMARHAQFAVDMAFRAAGASEEQRTQARAIVARHVEAAADLHAQRAVNRREGLEALTGDRVDREKLETVRQAQMQLAEAGSKELTSAIAELAEVLTPEQRAELREIGARFHH